jgi:hypothetical protein
MTSWIGYQDALEAMAPIVERLAGDPTEEDRDQGWDWWKWRAAREMVEDWRMRIGSTRQLLGSHYGWVTRALFDLDVDTEHGVGLEMVRLSVQIGDFVEGREGSHDHS